MNIEKRRIRFGTWILEDRNSKLGSGTGKRETGGWKETETNWTWTRESGNENLNSEKIKNGMKSRR